MLHRSHSLPRTVTAEHLVDQVAASLRCLGDTPGEVHWTLLYEGVRGLTHANTFGNPVVRYLSRRLDVNGLLEMRPSELLLRVGDEDYVLPLPPAVADFLARFNQGQYPEIDGA